MRWIINLDDSKGRQRIKVLFEPTEEKLYFIGEYKYKGNSWLKFSEVQTKMEINLDELKEAMKLTVENMRERIVVHENLDKTFDMIQNIEIK